MEKVKVSVIGVGHLGSIHARLWTKHENAELVGVRDIIPERATASAEENNCKVFDDLESAIEAADAVTIAVPTSIHFEIAKACIERGKHCLIEKPITETYDDAMKLIDLAKRHNVQIQVGHVERFNPVISAIKKYNIKPLFIEAHRLGQFKPRARDVSVIHDLMIHDIDIILWLVKSKIISVHANGVNVLTDTTDIANARLTFENGAVANITASRISANPMRKMRIFQRDTYFSLDFQKLSVDVFKIYPDDEKPDSGTPATMLGSLETGLKNKNIFFEKPHVEEINAILEEQKAFADTILTNSPIQVGAFEASEALRVAEIIMYQIYN
ncbi:MAG: oxidoreductase [Ignavibacteriae bacterium HGW-Ignavibacteriae-1]|jgi:predicted dehydrogenase|nr:MAG: oxidoreductase [Ignavibacteriae bacterium HGW-Ignavibacteriae-1]